MPIIDRPWTAEDEAHYEAEGERIRAARFAAGTPRCPCGDPDCDEEPSPQS